MNWKLKVLRTLSVILVLLAATSVGHHVLAGDLEDDRSSVAGITEGPDPIGALAGGNGHQSGAPGGAWPTAVDDSPGVAFLPGPRVLEVWAQDVGGDHDIVFSEREHLGVSGTPRFLTSSPVDERDPAIHAEPPGDVCVVWWENAEPQSVLLRRRPAGSDEWDPPLLVTQHGRRPSVTAVGGDLLIAFERDGLARGQEIVVASLGRDGRAFRLVVVAETERSDPLDLRFGIRGGRLRLEWNVAPERRAFAELRAGVWTSPALHAAANTDR
jgi:hypothetical protein